MADYSLKEDALNEISSLFTEYVEGVKDAILEIFSDYESTLSKVSYKPLYDLATNLVSHYNEEIIGAINSSCEEWAQGNTSFVAVAKKHHVGEEAENRAQQKQQTILDNIENLMKAQDPLQNIHLDVEANFTLQDFIDLKDEVMQSIGKLEAAKDEHINEFEELKEKNIAAAGIYIVAKNIGETTHREFADITKKTLDDLYEKVEEAGKTSQEGISEDVKDMPQKTIASLEQQRAELMGKIADIFNDDDL